MDLLVRPSQKEKRTEEFKEEFSINEVVKAGMSDYTKTLKNYLNTDSNIVSKRVLEAMYLGDEQTLALVVLRTVVSILIRHDNGMVLLSSLSKMVNKSILQSKSLEQLKEHHASLDAYIDMKYKRDESRKIRAKLRSHLKLFGETQEKFFLEERSSADSIGSLVISLIIESFDLIEIIKLDRASRFQGKHYPQFKPLSYVVKFSEETKYALVDLDYTADELLKPSVLPVLEKPKMVTKWYDKSQSLVTTGRPPNLVKMPKRKQDLREFRKIMDDNLDVTKFNKIHHAIESTAWTINEDVYDVMQQIFNMNLLDEKKKIFRFEHYWYNPTLKGGLPRRYGLEPDKMIRKDLLGSTYKDEKGRTWFTKDESKGINKYNEIKNDLMAYNERNLNKALSLMSMFRVCEEFKGKTFYFTYQYDTRFRIYPVQNILNPQSDSFGKALLKFVSDAEPLDEDGEYWAKVHGANCFGLDKAPLEDRVQLIDKMIADRTLQKIATKPIDNVDLWCDTDSPYEFLAFCIEYNKHLENPKHKFAIPVALDATCSGIQIYSGLLKDKEGAKAVNVVGSDRSDIYGMVAQESNRLLKNRQYERYISYSNKNGNEKDLDLRPIADSLVGKINRSITKRNTMTQPYSVTMRGMQDQLKETFTEMEEEGDKWWVGESWEVSRLLAGVNQKAIDNVVVSATKGKDFIKEITGIIAKQNKGLLYTTKFGGVVYQKNLKSKATTVWSHIWTPDRGVERVRFSVQEKARRVNVSAQKSASAPNFIHSLDTTQLHLCVDGCRARGVKGFALVHDSYGTHPNKVYILNDEVRGAFVELFSEDVLYDWAIEVLTNAGFTFEEIAKIFSEIEDPMVNTLDLEEVHYATYFFS